MTNEEKAEALRQWPELHAIVTSAVEVVLILKRSGSSEWLRYKPLRALIGAVEEFSEWVIEASEQGLLAPELRVVQGGRSRRKRP